MTLNFHTKVNSDNNSIALLSFFPNYLSPTIKGIRRKTGDNIHHPYLFPPTPEASWTVKNMNVVNEIIGVV